MNTIILIPAYKPEESFVEFSRLLTERGHAVVAVDDGGGEAFRDVFRRVRELGVDVVTHEVNRGKGRALKTGLQHIVDNYPETDFVVTADCDGQHKLEDIERIIDAEKSRPNAIIIGGRFQDKSVKIPFKSRLGNGVTRLLFRVATGLKIHDTQTGLRGLPATLFDKLLKLEGERYEYEMNMLLYMRDWDCDYVEIPIETVYINENAGSHYSPLRDSLRILARIIKFAASSLVCFLLDYVLFILFSRFVFAHGDKNLSTLMGLDGKGFFVTLLGSISLSYILARIISSACNYTLNRRIVFKKGTKHSAVKYFVLSAMIMLVGSLLTGLMIRFLPLPGTICKIIVDSCLYFVNFYFQREWVFRKRKPHGK
ncbi:MAG: bifunctional glycosyltransferase family 2/GtrA family protein [Clostridia bacterium]|nr:bifunctional glycosyltransferase family 2/GtrA family protein [Clostridia bacterium]